MGDEGKLQKHYATFEVYLKKSKAKFESKINSDFPSTAKMEDFKQMQTLGTGTFGKVALCQHKSNGKYYAMKIMEKANIIRTRQLVHTVAEIRCMDAFSFPFLVNLEYFFKNNVYIFIVMPFVNGGEMFYHLRAAKKFDETLCKFYAAQVIMAFEYMHYLGIIYRDLKPENILVDLEGYLKITDYGFCKRINNQRTYTLCGTPEYLAPEIILSQGYNHSVDWWSFGVLVFEMAAGYPPFYAKDPMKLYEKIVSAKYACPTSFSKPLKNLVTNILQVDRTKRFGLLKSGVKDIKGHEWFRTVDFDKIFSRKAKPPFKPAITGECDTKFFDSYVDVQLRAASRCEYEDEFKNFNIEAINQYRTELQLIWSLLQSIVDKVLMGQKYIERQRATGATFGSFETLIKTNSIQDIEDNS